MKAETMQLQQGTAEWHAHRSKSFNASEAAAMLGLSPYKSRAELLREKATGIVKEVDAATQARFDRGHAIEAHARTFAENAIGAELFPVVLSAEVDGLPLSASLDGLTMLEDVSWECKTARADLLEDMRQNTIPEWYKYQLEQGLMLSGAERCLFTASDGSGIIMHVWYESDHEIRRKLLAGWKQFAEDLANYQHVETPAEVVGATVEGLPALFVQVEGRVVATNMDGFKAAAAKFLDRLPNAASLETDQDFADADRAVKACEEAEDRMKLVKSQAQAQAVEIDEVFRAMDDIAARIRNARLALTKAVTKRKDDIRSSLVMQANKDLAEHIKKMNASLGGEWMPVVDGGFATAIKGRKTMAGLRDAIDAAMADAKILANEIANTIHQNLRHLEITYANESLIAPDFKAICTKAPEDFAALLAMRKRQHDEVIEQQRQIAEAEQRAKAISEDVKPVPNMVRQHVFNHPVLNKDIIDALDLWEPDQMWKNFEWPTVADRKCDALERKGLKPIGVILAVPDEPGQTQARRVTVDRWGRVQWWSVDGSGNMVPNVEVRGAEPACRRSVPLDRLVGSDDDGQP